MKKFEIFLFFGIWKTVLSNINDESVEIGGAYEDGSREFSSEIYFELAVQSFSSGSLKLGKVSEQSNFGDEFEAAQAVCEFIKNGAIGIIGPTSPEAAMHVRSICDAKEIPLIELSIDGSSKHVINLHPTPEQLGKAYLDLINMYEWHSFTILYQDAPWIPLVEYLIENHNDRDLIRVYQIGVLENDDFRSQLRRVKESSDKNIVLCCSVEVLPEVLKQAQQVGLLSDEHKVIITSLDMHTIDLKPFQYGGTNITGFRMVSPDNSIVNSTTSKLREIFQEKFKTANLTNNEKAEILVGLSTENMKLKTALTYDAVLLFAHVMAQHSGVHSDGITCEDLETVFVNGTSIFNSMKTVTQLKGLSGNLLFDQHGNRENFELDVMELSYDGLEKVATWNATDGYQSVRLDKKNQKISNDIKNKHLKVLIALNRPFAMLKESISPLQGNARFEGFVIDAIEGLSRRLQFTYTLELSKDGSYGYMNEDGEWNGMMREVMDGTVDLGLTDLTITSDRERVVDFTVPFMSLGITILYEKPKVVESGLFSFMDPFSRGDWFRILISYFIVSIVLFIAARLSPAEWINPYPWNKKHNILENNLSFADSMFYSVAGLFRKHCNIAPRGPSTRFVASVWLFFTLVMVSAYIANLVALMNVETRFSYIEGIEDLMTGHIPYGAKNRGSTLAFFRDSENPAYRRMYEYMISNPQYLPRTTEEGLNMVRAGNYAFLMESVTVDYLTERYCDIAQRGGLLDNRGFGIAMKKFSPYRRPLSQGILAMQESGELFHMKQKWWSRKHGGGACNADDEYKVSRLNMKEIGGVFVVLFFGCLFALILGIFKWLLYMKKIAETNEIRFGKVLENEIKFLLKFGTHVKTKPKKNVSMLIEMEEDFGST